MLQGKSQVSILPLQLTEIPEWPFNKIATDLVTECETSTSGNKHSITIIDHLTGWLEAFPVPDKSVDTIASTFIKHYLPVHMCPRYILSDNGTEFKNQLMDQQLSFNGIFSAPYHTQSSGKLEVFHKYLKPTLKKLCKKDPANWDKYLDQFLVSYRVTPNLATLETPFFLSMAEIQTYHSINFYNQYNASPKQSRIWTTQPRSPLTHPSYCEENIKWELLQDCPEDHGQRTTFFQTRQQSLF